MTLLEHGRTRLDTQRDRARRQAAGLLALLGAAAAIWCAAALAALLTGHGFTWPALHFRSPVTGGSGGLLGLPQAGQANVEPTRPQFPITITWPAPGWLTALIALPLWAGWLRWAVRPVLGGLNKPVRHRGLAPLHEIRAQLGERAARKAARFTRPDLAAWLRPLVHHTEVALRLGRATTPRDKSRDLLANLEQRVRIVARTGWGKTARLLVPIIRGLPGPALISSTEPAIFNQTVQARHHRRRHLRWPLLDRLARHRLPVGEYPVAVVDCSPASSRWTSGWPQARVNPIQGSANWATADRRARALVRTGTTGEADDDGVFTAAACDVLAAWLHAADLGGYTLDDIQSWLTDTSTRQARRILATNRHADPIARMVLEKHLDSRAERTSSGVERFVALALASVLSAAGRRIAGNGSTDQLDMQGFIAAGGTLYLLAQPAQVKQLRPFLSMIANEMFHAAEAVALTRRRARLAQPFVGVLDEVAYGATVTDLPYVVNGQRKFGISVIWSVQSSSQEDTIYGPEAQAIRDGAGVSVYGGIDIDHSRQISDRAGQTSVVTATRGDHNSEHVAHQDALSIADQQDLDDGESVVVARGLKPFLAFSESIHETRAGRAVVAEGDGVAARVAAARAGEQARAAAATTATEHGVDDNPNEPADDDGGEDTA